MLPSLETAPVQRDPTSVHKARLIKTWMSEFDESCESVNFILVFNISELTFTSQSLHPGALIYSQVVVDDLENVSQQSIHVFRGHRGAAVVGFVWVAFRSMFPPVRHVAAQHRQDHLQQ